MIKTNLLKSKVELIILIIFVSLAIFDLVSRSSFNVNIFYFTPLAILSSAYFFSFGEKVFKIIILILFFGISFLYFQGSLSIYTCRYNSDYSCLARKAVKDQNPSLCDMAKDDGVLDESSRAWCYRDLSKNWKDASICEKVKIGETMSYFGNYYDCISNIAVNTNNPSLCEKIEYDKKFSPNKKECYSNF